ncbi:hypothetical protein DZ860_00695 [Vibrio sinensis]|uniref:Uncharacterized protein n=1 Tax=Vibrio sinensis TaxID=2302434 RepID=A0A3A6QV84_9VIBR|nr:hypothetical protein DZ860_00695 [Vibrio sinensis]
MKTLFNSGVIRYEKILRLRRTGLSKRQSATLVRELYLIQKNEFVLDIDGIQKRLIVSGYSSAQAAALAAIIFDISNSIRCPYESLS